MAAAAAILAAALMMRLRVPHAPRRDPVDGALQVVADVSHDLALRREHGQGHQLQELLGIYTGFAEEAVHQAQTSAAVVHSEAVAADAGRAAVSPFLRGSQRARFWNRFWNSPKRAIEWNSPTASKSCGRPSHLQPLLQWVAI